MTLQGCYNGGSGSEESNRGHTPLLVGLDRFFDRTRARRGWILRRPADCLPVSDMVVTRHTRKDVHGVPRDEHSRCHEPR
jgi:hypothetical protein